MTFAIVHPELSVLFKVGLQLPNGLLMYLASYEWIFIVRHKAKMLKDADYKPRLDLISFKIELGIGAAMLEDNSNLLIWSMFRSTACAILLVSSAASLSNSPSTYFITACMCYCFCIKYCLIECNLTSKPTKV